MCVEVTLCKQISASLSGRCSVRVAGGRGGTPSPGKGHPALGRDTQPWGRTPNPGEGHPALGTVHPSGTATLSPNTLVAHGINVSLSPLQNTCLLCALNWWIPSDKTGFSELSLWISYPLFFVLEPGLMRRMQFFVRIHCLLILIYIMVSQAVSSN